jgi:hypothetical protein
MSIAHVGPVNPLQAQENPFLGKPCVRAVSSEEGRKKKDTRRCDLHQVRAGTAIRTRLKKKRENNAAKSTFASNTHASREMQQYIRSALVNV